ncbi:MAG: hypothetical protein KKA73_06790 [Chloroflexi bacterium]|nr:hypothetical protein [Chloroflexota bacterium]MBU1747379.1 hypothetical protein [Chloroflexota bacterium]
MKVLVVHPDTRTRAAISEALEDVNCQVAQALSVQEALDLMLMSSGVFDLVVASNVLGEQFLVTVKQRQPNVSVISLMHGAADVYLWPPVTVASLTQAVQAIHTDALPS